MNIGIGRRHKSINYVYLIMLQGEQFYWTGLFTLATFFGMSRFFNNFLRLYPLSFLANTPFKDSCRGGHQSSAQLNHNVIIVMHRLNQPQQSVAKFDATQYNISWSTVILPSGDHKPRISYTSSSLPSLLIYIVTQIKIKWSEVNYWLF